jgi:hypothetical protein
MNVIEAIYELDNSRYQYGFLYLTWDGEWKFQIKKPSHMEYVSLRVIIWDKFQNQEVNIEKRKYTYDELRFICRGMNQDEWRYNDLVISYIQ